MDQTDQFTEALDFFPVTREYVKYTTTTPENIPNWTLLLGAGVSLLLDVTDKLALVAAIGAGLVGSVDGAILFTSFSFVANIYAEIKEIELRKMNRKIACS